MLVRIPGSDLLAVKSLKNSQMALTEARIGDDLVASRSGNYLSGAQSASQIAAVKPREMFAGQSNSQSLGLGNASFRQIAIQVALTYAPIIPLRLPVPHNDNLSSIHRI